MTRRASTELDLHAPERKIGLVVHHDDIAGRDALFARQLRRGFPAQVHERLRTRGEHVVAVDGSFTDARRPLAPLAAELATPFELVKAHPADIVPGARIFAS